MKYLMLALLLVACGKTEPRPCRSGVAMKDQVLRVQTQPCDYRAKAFPLADGNVLCLCPEDVTKLTK